MEAVELKESEKQELNQQSRIISGEGYRRLKLPARAPWAKGMSKSAKSDSQFLIRHLNLISGAYQLLLEGPYLVKLYPALC